MLNHYIFEMESHKYIMLPVCRLLLMLPER